MTGHESQPRRTLDEYLDGVLEGDQREQAAQWVREDPRAASETQVQGRIDDSLRRLFAAGAPGAAAAPETAPSFRIGRPRVALIAAAAAAILLAVSAVLLVPLLEPRPDRLGQIYHTEVSTGFKPQEVCTTPDQFAGWVQKNYGQALYPAPDHSVELLGWSYGMGVTSYSGVLLTRVEGQPVVVVVDRASGEGRRLPTPEDPTLRVHRARVGDLVLYEVTPLPSSRVLPLLAEKPPSTS